MDEPDDSAPRRGQAWRNTVYTVGKLRLAKMT